MDASGYSLSDIAALMGNRDGGVFGGAGSGMGILIILFFLIFAGGFGGFGGRGGNGPATSDQVQGAFNYSNLLDQNRDLATAIANDTAQTVAAVNQAKYDNINVAKDIQMALTSELGRLETAGVSILAKQNECCCNTLRAIDGVNYANAQNTAAIQSSIASGVSDIKAQLSQNKIEALQSEVEALRLAQATSNVVRYPNAWTYNAGPSPFCGGCGCGC